MSGNLFGLRDSFRTNLAHVLFEGGVMMPHAKEVADRLVSELPDEQMLAAFRVLLDGITIYLDAALPAKDEVSDE